MGDRRGQALVALVELVDLVELVAGIGGATRVRELPSLHEWLASSTRDKGARSIVELRQRGKSRVAIISLSKVAMCVLFEGFTSS